MTAVPDAEMNELTGIANQQNSITAEALT